MEERKREGLREESRERGSKGVREGGGEKRRREKERGGGGEKKRGQWEGESK